jgi:hypothetical protein
MISLGNGGSSGGRPGLPPSDEAVVSATRFIEETSGIDGSDLGDIVSSVAAEIVGGAALAIIPGAIPVMVGAAPFLLGVAAIMIPISWLEKRLRLSKTPMPEDWYPSVLATASRDGRFFVGRLLSAEGKVVVSDAVKFLAVEKSAEARAAVDFKLPSVDSRAALVAYYQSERTILDRAMSLAGSSVVGAASAVGSLAGSLVSAGIRKFRVGF